VVASQQVLEIGSGTGLCGIMAAKLGAAQVRAVGRGRRTQQGCCREAQGLGRGEGDLAAGAGQEVFWQEVSNTRQGT
jgi:predicted RNA methylase